MDVWRFYSDEDPSEEEKTLAWIKKIFGDVVTLLNTLSGSHIIKDEIKVNVFGSKQLGN